MRWSLLLLLCLFSPLLGAGQAQPGAIEHPFSISRPETPDMSFEVHSMGQPLDFRNADDFATGKTIPGYFQVRIKSNVPWILSAIVPEQFPSIYAGAPSAQFDVALRSQKTGHMVRLSGAPQVILQSSNLAEHDYAFDLIVYPSFEMRSGKYNCVVNFQLSSL